MVGQCAVIAFVSTTKLDQAKHFYRDVLGMKLVEDAPFALVFDARGTMLRVSKVDALTPAPFTVLGWQVPNIRATMKNLMQSGVAFERYKGMPQDEVGIWTTPDGSQVSWFKDPDGNTLSLTEFTTKSSSPQ